jgi:hypothetical protein
LRAERLPVPHDDALGGHVLREPLADHLRLQNRVLTRSLTRGMQLTPAQFQPRVKSEYNETIGQPVPSPPCLGQGAHGGDGGGAQRAADAQPEQPASARRRVHQHRVALPHVSQRRQRVKRRQALHEEARAFFEAPPVGQRARLVNRRDHGGGVRAEARHRNAGSIACFGGGYILVRETSLVGDKKNSKTAAFVKA